MRQIAIIGTGAIGGYYGACLQRAGNTVHFLLRSDAEFVREHGLTIESCRGDFVLPHVHAHATVDTMPRCDLVFVALKATQNAILKDILPRVLAPDGVVVTLQNGMGADDDIAAIVGADRVLGGLCFICSNKVGAGHIRHLDYGSVTFGDYASAFGARGVTARVEALADLFRAAGVEALLTPDLMLARWRKLVWNIPYNGMSVVLNATTDVMAKDAGLRALFRCLMEEVRASAAAYGRDIPEEFLDQMEASTDRMTPYATSMMLDFQNHRTMEVEAIYGNPMRLALARGVSVPALTMLYRQLSFINSRFGV